MLQELMAKFKVGGVPQINPTTMDMPLAHRQNRQMLAAGGLASRLARKLIRKHKNEPEVIDSISKIEKEIENIDGFFADMGDEGKYVDDIEGSFTKSEIQELQKDRAYLVEALREIDETGRPLDFDETGFPSIDPFVSYTEMERWNKLGKIPSAGEDDPITILPRQRIKKQEGGELDAQMANMMPDDQIIAEAQAEDFAQEGMVPDEEMEEDYVEFIMSEALEPEEQQYLSEKLVEDDQLSMIFDKVVETASEFSGSGSVEGPGTGISDSIPARLSDGEFVMTAKATDAIGADTLDELMALAEQEADAGRQMKQTGGLITKEEEQEEQTQKVPSVVVEREQPLLVEEDPMQQKNKEAMRSLDPRLSLFAS